MSIESVMPSNHLILCRSRLLLPSIFPSIGSFAVSQFFASGGQSIQISASASVLPMNIQGWFPLGWLVWSPCSPRDSKESFPALQFRSINSSVLNFLYGPTLTSIHDYWENHSFDYMDLCQQSNVSAGVGGGTMQPTPQNCGRNDWTHDMIPLLLSSPPCCVTQTQCSLLILLLFTLSSFSNLLRKQK